MSASATPPLQDAILAWDAAVEAVVQETYRIAKGGIHDVAHLAKLHAAVEAARQRCEQSAIALSAKEDPH
jgi:hypothetical protein